MKTKYRHLRGIVSVLAASMLLLGAMAFLGCFQQPAGAATAAPQISQDLTIKGWGDNNHGQCNVPPGNNYVAADGGFYHSLALKSDGTLAAWGDNSYGQTTNVPAGNNYVAVAAGGFYSLALKSDGSLAAWGWDYNGPVTNVPAGNNYVAISAGAYHGLALKSDGSLVAWGYNFYGQCNVPVGNNYVAIASGYYHNLALKSDGSLVAWGYNYYGQCNVPAGNNYTAIDAGAFHSLALKSDGSLAAWGDNGQGQCNIPTGNNYTAIAAGCRHSLALKSDGSLAAWGRNVEGQTTVPAGNNCVAIAAGYSFSLALKPPSSLVGWGNNNQGQVTNVPAGNNYVAIATGNSHNLALKSDGSLVAWGFNGYGQCNVPAGNNYVAIAAGLYHSLALKSDGTLAAWGRNLESQCNVPAGNNYVAIAGGGFFSLALKSDNSLVAWGDDTHGQVTNAPLPSDKNYVAIDGGGFHSIAIKADGTLAAWGWDNYGQVTNIPAGNNYVAISAGDYHGLALKSDGSLAAWGRNTEGQCNVPAGNNYVAISAGSYFSLALKSDGTLAAWGSNTDGQCNVPAGTNYVAIAGGGFHSLALSEAYTVNASAPGGHGTVSPASQTINYGGTATINITPNAGYNIGAITDNGSPVAITSSYVINNITGNHDVEVTFEPEGATTFYFAEGYTGTGFDEWLCLMNASTSPTTAHITYMFKDGSTQPQDVSIGATSRATVNVNGAVGTGKDVSIKITADSPIVAERPMYFNYKDKWTGGHDVVGATSLESSFYFAEGYTGTGFDEWLCLMNAASSPTTAHITYMFKDGSTQPQDVEIGATSRATVDVNQAVGTGKDVSIKITADSPIVAERPMYFNYKDKWTGGHDVVGATSLESSFYFAEGYTGTGFDEWLCLMNAASSPTTAHITYMFKDGSTQPQDVEIGATSRATVDVNQAVGSGKDVSIKIIGDSPIVAERPMYFNYKDKWTGGHDVVGATSLESSFYFAEGYTGAGFDEWLCLMNAGSSPTTAHITYMFKDGTTKPQDVSIGATSRATVDVNAAVGPGKDVSIKITADSPIVAERPMYFNYKDKWTGGHDVVGFSP